MSLHMLEWSGVLGVGLGAGCVQEGLRCTTVFTAEVRRLQEGCRVFCVCQHDLCTSFDSA